MFTATEIAVVIIVLADAFIIAIVSRWVNKHITVPMVRKAIINFFRGFTDEDKKDLNVAVNGIYIALEPKMTQLGNRFIIQIEARLRTEVKANIEAVVNNNMGAIKERLADLNLENIEKRLAGLNKLLGANLHASGSEGAKATKAQNRKNILGSMNPMEQQVMKMAKDAGGVKGQDFAMGIWGALKANQQRAKYHQMLKADPEMVAQVRAGLDASPEAKMQLMNQDIDSYNLIYGIAPQVTNIERNHTSIHGAQKEVSVLQGNAYKEVRVSPVQEPAQDGDVERIKEK